MRARGPLNCSIYFLNDNNNNNNGKAFSNFSPDNKHILFETRKRKEIRI